MRALYTPRLSLRNDNNNDTHNDITKQPTRNTPHSTTRMLYATRMLPDRQLACAVYVLLIGAARQRCLRLWRLFGLSAPRCFLTWPPATSPFLDRFRLHALHLRRLFLSHSSSW